MIPKRKSQSSRRKKTSVTDSPSMVTAGRLVNRTIPAPKRMENIPRMVPSKNMVLIHQTRRFQPVAPPETVGSE